MQKLSFLKPKDSIYLIAPSGIIDSNHIEQAVKWIEKNGFTPKVGIHLTDNFFRFSATDEHRLFDLQKALDCEQTKAIWCIRGGYGMTRILDKLNWDKFLEYPKWLIGFSDITAIHLKINRLSFKSMHGFMPVQFKYLEGDNLENQQIEKTLASFFDAITGKSYQISSKSHQKNKLGQAEAEIIGGNLSMIINSLATPTEINTDNKILFLEEVGENLYAVDRMLGQLFRAGKLKNLKGIVIGSFSDSKQTVEQFGFSVEQMILDLTKEYTYPVAFDFPIGHTAENETVICGANVIFEVNNEGGILKFLQNAI
ncbi:putative MccF-like protein (microcin C7 resistance) [Bernardetia litoralis DSM 6794]|uniref:Putative MccF-like protein (Microcin C7 resistance) n=1 Tax=Bernardetia litoralis (strain ATCC 23117 / DSM 6794 / NBRC 15988 / NCIMB 1366 / Fx l1 / Sio-4) TaxID=880071 RepID=I4APD5_BERLS|nr:LD-carboxypeptidase [Bernardetia litoralis]AFM05820.1 putative MccF-like protein (microcin C7 resistance) [Bernardetia litoralis DSM 6794]